MPGGITFTDASTEADARSHDGESGHLATITTSGENAFLAFNFPQAISPVGYRLGASKPFTAVPATDGWAWVTGGPFVFTNWTSGEPNNSEGNEDSIQFSRDDAGQCNGDPGDPGVTEGFTVTGYVVEYLPLTTAVPSTSVWGLAVGATVLVVVGVWRFRRTKLRLD